MEVFNKHVLAACRALMTDLRLAPHDWSDVFGIIETKLNEEPLARLRKREDGTFHCPLEVMTGIKPRCTLLVGTEPTLFNVDRLTVERFQAERLTCIEVLQPSLEMHKNVVHKVSTTDSFSYAPTIRGETSSNRISLQVISYSYIKPRIPETS